MRRALPSGRSWCSSALVSWVSGFNDKRSTFRGTRSWIFKFLESESRFFAQESEEVQNTVDSIDLVDRVAALVCDYITPRETLPEIIISPTGESIRFPEGVTETTILQTVMRQPQSVYRFPKLFHRFAAKSDFVRIVYHILAPIWIIVINSRD
jgi:hypothetical protein